MREEKQDSAATSTSHQEDQKVLWMATMPIGLVINHAMGMLTLYVKLPVYLDNIGALLVTILVGSRAGVINGLMTVLLGGLLINPMYPYYTANYVVVPLFGGWLAKIGFFRSIPKAILGGIMMGVISGLCTAPIVALFGGFSGTCTDVTTALFLATGQSLFTSAFLANVANDPLDKIIQCLLVVWLLRGFPKSLKARFANSGYLMRNVAQ